MADETTLARAIKNSVGKVLYEIGGTGAPFYGAMCKDAQMYGSYWRGLCCRAFNRLRVEFIFF